MTLTTIMMSKKKIIWKTEQQFQLKKQLKIKKLKSEKQLQVWAILPKAVNSVFVR